MIKFKKIKYLLNNKKLLEELEESKEIIKQQNDLITQLNQDLRDYEQFPEKDDLIARKKDLENLIDHYHQQKKEFREEIKQLKSKIIELKETIQKLKNKDN